MFEYLLSRKWNSDRTRRVGEKCVPTGGLRVSGSGCRHISDFSGTVSACVLSGSLPNGSKPQLNALFFKGSLVTAIE